MADVTTTFTGDNNEDTIVLALARQLEYYFSKQNLAHDTYLKTLMSLNDGCVPLTILASFRKVRAICGHDSRYILDVLQTNRYLQLFKIDTTTSKRVADELLSANTILAVGPRYEPLLNSSSSAATFAVSMMNNTIVLEINTVPTTVTRNEVEALLDSNCPPVTSITRNAANWWYITFDSNSIEEMERIMMKLRSCTLADQYVYARLKASPSIMDMTAPGLARTTWASESSLYAMQHQSRIGAYSNKTKPKTKKKSRQLETGKKQSDDKDQQPKTRNKQGKLQDSSAPPPALTEDQFPTLQGNKVEWEASTMDESQQLTDTNGDDEEEEDQSRKSNTDGASTATTACSSLDSCRKVIVGGYAAALMKHGQKEVSSAMLTKQLENKPIVDKPTSTVASKKENDVLPWGGGRSFADILRSTETQRVS